MNTPCSQKASSEQQRRSGRDGRRPGNDRRLRTARRDGTGAERDARRIRLQDGNGLDLLKRAKQLRPSLAVVMISGRDDAGLHTQARPDGAAGLLPKTATPDVIVSIHRNRLANRRRSVRPRGLPGTAGAHATPERNLRPWSAEGHANKEIRYRLGISERTVRAHLTELFQQLGATSRLQAVLRGPYEAWSTKPTATAGN